jgi:DNA-binding MarR family transcriptional regulator
MERPHVSKPGAHDRAAAARASLPEVGIGMLLRRADMAFNRLLRDKLAVHDITFSQFQHLLKLWAEDGLNQAEISRRIGIEKASSTMVLDSLDQRGLIRRERDAVDRRKINVFLTASGAALRPKLRAAAKLANTIARHGLSPAEFHTLFDLVERVTANIQRHEAGPETERRTSKSDAHATERAAAN